MKMNKNEFKELYIALPSLEQELLLLISLVNKPIRATYIIRLAEQCGLVFKGLKQKHKLVLVKNLEKKELITFFENDGFIVSPETNRELLKLHGSKKDSNLHKYFGIIQETNKKDYYHLFSYGTANENKMRKQDFLVSLYSRDEKSFEQAILNKGKSTTGEILGFILGEFVDQFNSELMGYIPDKYKDDILGHVYNDGGCLKTEKAKLEFIAYIEQHGNTKKSASLIAGCYEDLGLLYFHDGNTQKLQVLINNGAIDSAYYDASFEFLKSNINKAYELYSIENQRVLGKSKKQYIPPDIHGVYFCLTLLIRKESQKLLHDTITAGIRQSPVFFKLIKAYLAFVQGDVKEQNKHIDRFNVWNFDEITVPLAVYFLYIIDKKQVNSNSIDRLKNILKMAYGQNHDWLAVQCYLVMKLAGKINEVGKKLKSEIESKCKDYFDITSIHAKQKDWERSLTILNTIANNSKVNYSDTQYNSERLVWFVNTDYASLYFSPRLQNINKSGVWSKGRPVALKRIMQREIECMLPLDNLIAGCVLEERVSTYGYYYDTNYTLEHQKAMPHFLEHPYLFLESSPQTPFELIKEDIHLMVNNRHDHYTLSLSQDIESAGAQFIRETASRYKVLEITDKHVEIVHALGKDKVLKIPLGAEKELGQLVNKLSAIITIQSDLKDSGVDAGSDTISIKADSKTHVHLLPVGESIRAEFFVRPFKKDGPYFKPGYGGQRVLSNIKGRQMQTDRDLHLEKSLAIEVHKKCPSFAIRGGYKEIFEFDTLEESLEALLEIQELKNDVIIEWPEGEKLKIVKKYALDDIFISVVKKNDWFELKGGIGDLTPDREANIINLQKLLAMPAHSKFIELSNGEFAALTEQLKKKRDELLTYSYLSNGEIKIHPLNANAADDILSEIKGFKSGKKWKEQIAKAKNAIHFSPELPSTLKADLRPYQLEGFNWLSRLANWGVGACLADDMGLGKTIQALAVILERAAKGPTLVIAPSSVCLNWIAEIAKFAPTLNTIFFAEEKRAKALAKLKPFDVLICSYNLMMYEQDKLSKVQWTTTVLDEAQFIKNYKSKRTKAAFNLDSAFRLITTGTPIENHLSEIWTLFSYLNPGFLGTQNEFARKFIMPIENEGCTNAKNSLKKILAPFILRRLKTDVLEELPAKTEINHMIDLSKDEQDFYEALRRSSVENIEDAKEQKGASFHMQILAELIRLRRACCHSSLVSGNAGIESSKIKEFLHIIGELKENKHKALVFSQFVGFLSILRESCDNHGISYQYLDGSTPIKIRQERINAFQSGEGDIFLISLKAGGTGMNLTAADYVIHTDPWWNPAVEDQASDRAHRIGQKRPVTIYRFITKNTIEEKIITLHKQKRELANSLLEGTDMTGKMSSKELFELI